MKGLLTISHFSGSSEGVSIEVTDKLSGIPFLELEISHEQFGRALGSQACRPCEFELRDTERVGKRMEVKTVMLPRYLGQDREVALAKSLEDAQPYEVDGWVAEIEQAYRTQQHGHYLVVVFRRYVNVGENGK